MGELLGEMSHDALCKAVQRQEFAIAQLYGQVRALEVLATTLIASHHAPAAALAAWEVVKEAEIDHNMGTPLYENPTFRDAFHWSLSRLELPFRRSAQTHADRDPG